MISVILPTYNRADYIYDSAMSVLQQTYTDIELIIVDDGSIDNTKEVVEKIEDRRCQYVYQENRGACAARNHGIHLAKGEYIAFHDSDDIWYKDKLEKQMKVLEKENDDIVFCAFFRREDKSFFKIPDENFDIQTLNFKKLLRGNVISTQTILCKSKCLKEEKFNETMPRFQDWELMLRMIQKYKIGYCQEALVDVYVQQDSISMDYAKAYTAVKKIYKLHREVINEDMELKEHYKHFINNFKKKAELEKLSKDDMMQKIIDLENQLIEERKIFYESTSWKITAPIRWILQQKKKLMK